MAKRVSRRQFVQASTAGLAIAAARRLLDARRPSRPAASSRSWCRRPTANRFKNGGAVTGVQKAFDLITKGSDVLDAVIAGVNLCELDPEDASVGYGGCRMPRASCSSTRAACTDRRSGRRRGEHRRRPHPSLVAKAVLEMTDHHLIVGKDAQAFARSMGFKIEDDLNTEYSRKMWLEWKRRVDPSTTSIPRSAARRRWLPGSAWFATG
jgi:N4-(beta-N-acetylglucosaminyl)-L-asparaginase